MPDISIALSLLKRPVEVALSKMHDGISKKYQSIKNQAKIKQLYSKLAATQKVKTIWHTERALSISTIYYPVSIKIHEKATQVVENLDDFLENCILIVGTAGQGKSTYLRYLLGKEIKSGERVPLFYELRNRKGNSLKEELSKEVSRLFGTENSLELFNVFAEAGLLSNFLDGFDEVDQNLASEIANEIQQLASNYSSCRFVVSARPDSGIEYLTEFVVKEIAPLTHTDLPQFYKKITKDQDFALRLVAAINTSPVRIQELIRTPLLATLLAMSYKSAQRIPLDFVEFYEQLFYILFVRHDRSKAGFSRILSSKLTDREIQLVFEGFSFNSRKATAAPIHRENAIEYTRRAIEMNGLIADPTKVLDDIQKVSCLLLKDGIHY